MGSHGFAHMATPVSSRRRSRSQSEIHLNLRENVRYFYPILIKAEFYRQILVELSATNCHANLSSGVEFFRPDGWMGGETLNRYDSQVSGTRLKSLFIWYHRIT
jgi:hypothetical protein